MLKRGGWGLGGAPMHGGGGGNKAVFKQGGGKAVLK